MIAGWTPAALADLQAIDRWLRKEARRGAAPVTLKTIGERSNFPREFPRCGRLYKDDLRLLRVIGTLCILRYRIVDEGVQGLRIRHEREDWFVEP